MHEKKYWFDYVVLSGVFSYLFQVNICQNEKYFIYCRKKIIDLMFLMF